MSDYFDCIIWKETKAGKKFARHIGSAKKRDDGGFNVYLDALPPDGKFTIAPQRDRQAQQSAARDSQSPLDDEIPF